MEGEGWKAKKCLKIASNIQKQNKQSRTRKQQRNKTRTVLKKVNKKVNKS